MRVLDSVIGLALLGLALPLSGCTDQVTAKRVLGQQGYHDIVLSRWSPWSGCSQSDELSTAFHAKNLAGNEVEGVVCSSWGFFGLGKAATIRLY